LRLRVCPRRFHLHISVAAAWLAALFLLSLKREPSNFMASFFD
jgi:hypothetical protein